MSLAMTRMPRLGLWGALSVVAACGAKDHPPALNDETLISHDATAMHEPQVDADVQRDASSDSDMDAARVNATDGGGRVDSGGMVVIPTDPLVAALAKLCSEKPPYGAMLCYATEKNHPADTAIFRNMDKRNGVLFGNLQDATHRQLVAVADYQGHDWKLTIDAPTGMELVTGSYSTDSNDGTSLSFTWDEGACPGKESATFEVFAITWDGTGTPTSAEIDFKHHCGEMSAPALLAKYRLNSSRL